MYYKPIADELLAFVKQGFFNHIWYLIKEYRNYRILFVLSDFDEYDSEGVRISKGENKIIGTLSAEGFRDSEDNPHVISFPERKDTWLPPTNTDSADILFHQLPPIPLSEEINSKEYFPDKNISISSLDPFILPKIEQAIWLLLTSNPNFEEFGDSIAGQLSSDSPSYDYYLQFISSVKTDDGEIINKFIGFDCEAIFDIDRDLGINFNLDETLTAARQLLYATDDLSKHPFINNFSSSTYFELLNLENKFLYKSNIIREDVIKYHVIIEEMMLEIFDYFAKKYPFIIGKIFRPAYKNSSSINFNNIKTVYYSIKNMFEDDSLNKQILNEEVVNFISANLDGLKSVSGSSIYRHGIVHSIKYYISPEDLKKYISIYRSIIEFLIVLFSKLKHK